MSAFFYPVKVYVGANALVSINVTTSETLPASASVGDCIIYTGAAQAQGFYIFNGAWQLGMSEIDLSASAIFAKALTIYLNVPLPLTLLAGITIFKNGVVQAGATGLTVGSDVWITATPLTSPPLSVVNIPTLSVAIGGTGLVTLDTLDLSFSIGRRTFAITLIDIVCGSTDAYQILISEYAGLTLIKTHYQSSSLTGLQKDAIPFAMDKVNASNSLVLSVINQGTAIITSFAVRFVLGSV